MIKVRICPWKRADFFTVIRPMAIVCMFVVCLFFDSPSVSLSVRVTVHGWALSVIRMVGKLWEMLSPSLAFMRRRYRWTENARTQIDTHTLWTLKIYHSQVTHSQCPFPLKELMEIVACVLHLGNIQFGEDEEGETHVTTEPQLQYLSQVSSVYSCLKWVNVLSQVISRYLSEHYTCF